MAKLHYLPTATSIHSRVLKQMAGDMIGMHPDEHVASSWSEMAEESLQRYPGPPKPSMPIIALDDVPELSCKSRKKLHSIAKHWQESYFQDVRMQLMSIHRDMLCLQRRVAELERQQTRSQSAKRQP